VITEATMQAMIDSDEEMCRAENIVVDEACRNLLLNYAQIPADDVQQHAEKIVRHSF
jgi:hypothetical protein